MLRDVTFNMYILYVSYARMHCQQNNCLRLDSSKQLGGEQAAVLLYLSSFSAAVPLIVVGSKRGPTRASVRGA